MQCFLYVYSGTHGWMSPAVVLLSVGTNTSSFPRVEKQVEAGCLQKGHDCCTPVLHVSRVVDFQLPSSSHPHKHKDEVEGVQREVPRGGLERAPRVFPLQHDSTVRRTSSPGQRCGRGRVDSGKLIVPQVSGVVLAITPKQC